MSFLHVDHVTHTYFSIKEKTTAVRDIHFDAEKGDFISFLGPSGCGIPGFPKTALSENQARKMAHPAKAD